MFTPYNSKASKYGLPLDSYATQFNDFVGTEAETVALTLVAPAGVAIRRVDRDVRINAEDRTAAADTAVWDVLVYHNGKSAEGTNFNIQEILPEGAVVNAVPDISYEEVLLDPDDDFFISQEDLQNGYNTIVATVEMYITPLPSIIIGPPPPPSPPVLVGSATLSYLIYKEFDAEVAVIAAEVFFADEVDLVVPVATVTPVLESVDAAETPDPGVATEYDRAVLLDPLIKG